MTVMLLGGIGVGSDPVVNHKSLSTSIYTDHFERRVGRTSVASHNISYRSSVDVTALEYGNHPKRCQFTFGNFTLSRQFSYDILHQSQPYGVKHVQLGARSWVRRFPSPNGDVKGTCSAALNGTIDAAAAAANTLGTWKDVVDQDDSVVRHSLEADVPKLHSAG